MIKLNTTLRAHIACAAFAMCGAVPAQAAEGASLTMRQAIERLSPVTAEALRRVEFQRGRHLEDSEISGATNAPEFNKTVEKVTSEFCDQPRNRDSFACIDRVK